MKCPFAAPLMKATAACPHAREVVRRGGSEFDCDSELAHDRCEQVFAGLKACALAASNIEDDPTQMPHSLLVKIQSGGLIGLQRLLGEPDAEGRVADIGDLVTRASAHFGGADRIPYAALTEDMTAFRLERRAGRRR
ncbi:hypothetical protein [Thiocapsa bogorovii]|uniref:hypothetical protein n=1 Tax=Thiocapsa bogorovii TaxID=521689 RepID=UPI001E54BCE9|nr:hypothetical protein [Thiocapsa bogorovii]UHD16164.1 hypothetical protein LT988_23445 [Thiocapsa bogorovii]